MQLDSWLRTDDMGQLLYGNMGSVYLFIALATFDCATAFGFRQYSLDKPAIACSAVRGHAVQSGGRGIQRHPIGMQLGQDTVSGVGLKLSYVCQLWDGCI